MPRSPVSGRLGTELYQAFYIHTILATGTIVLLLAAAGFTLPYVLAVISPTTFYITPEDGPTSVAPPAGQINLYPCIYPATETPINATDQECGHSSWCAEGFSCGNSPLDEEPTACYNNQFECKNTTACWQHYSIYPIVETSPMGWQLPFSLSITWLVISFVSLAANLIFCIVELIYFIFIRMTTQISDACKTFSRLPKPTRPKATGSWGLVLVVILYLIFCVVVTLPLLLSFFFGLEDTFDIRRALWDGCFYDFNYWPMGNFYVFCMSFAAAIAVLNFFNLILLPATWISIQRIRNPDASALLSESVND